MNFCFTAVAFLTLLSCCDVRAEAISIESEGLLSIDDHTQIPLNLVNKEEQPAYAAYIQGVLDTKFPENGVTISVRHGVVIFSHLPKDPVLAQAMVSYVRDLVSKPILRNTHTLTNGKRGVRFPESSILYPTQIANPRQIAYSCGWRGSDKIAGHWSAPVSFADRFPIYRWCNLWKGDVQLEIEGGVFGLFNMSRGHFPLVNADYYVGLPLTYAKDQWRGKVRLYHISSHLGDEYILSRRCHVHRKNKSFEALDFSCAYYVLPELYFFGTLGSIFASDSEFYDGRCYAEYGFEVRGDKKVFEQLYRQPFLSVFCRNAQENHFKQDVTMALGYEWGKLNYLGRLFRAFIEYHQGFSVEGQFSHKKSNYVSLKISYGF